LKFGQNHCHQAVFLLLLLLLIFPSNCGNFIKSFHFRPPLKQNKSRTRLAFYGKLSCLLCGGGGGGGVGYDGGGDGGGGN